MTPARAAKPKLEAVPDPDEDGVKSGHVELPGGHSAVLRPLLDITRKDRRAADAAWYEMGAAGRALRGDDRPPGEAAVTSPDPTKPDEADTSPLRLDLLEGVQRAREHFTDVCLALYVESWDFDLPVAPESMEEIPLPVLDALTELAQSFAAALYPQLSKKDDEEDPTAP